MGLPSNEIQRAIYAQLTAQIPATPVYDFVPQNVAPPYIVIGDDTMVSANDKTTQRHEYTITIHVWDRNKSGRKSTKTLLSSVYDALNHQETALTMTGFQTISMQHEFETTMHDEGNEGDKDRYYHGVQRYRMIVEKT